MPIPEVCCFGEIIMDGYPVTPGGKENKEEETYEYFLGGAPTNTAMGLGKLHVPVSLIAQVGMDMHGYNALREIKHNGVSTEQILVDSKRPTSTSHITLAGDGERTFTFYSGAHNTIEPESVHLPGTASIFHFGSLLQTTDQAKRTTHRLLHQAQEAGALISYDPNYRDSLWNNPELARSVILDTLPFVHILKINEEELKLLTYDYDTVGNAIERLFHPRMELMVVTLGDKGCKYKTAHHEGYIPTIPVKAVDTTGAGDAFNAGLLWGLYETPQRPSEMSKDQLEFILYRANVIGALTTTKKGAISAFPTQIETFATLRNFPLFFLL
jgi:sugar/nucleoside kinase (ribokinase family)